MKNHSHTRAVLILASSLLLVGSIPNSADAARSDRNIDPHARLLQPTRGSSHQLSLLKRLLRQEVSQFRRTMEFVEDRSVEKMEVLAATDWTDAQVFELLDRITVAVDALTAATAADLDEIAARFPDTVVPPIGTTRRNSLLARRLVDQAHRLVEQLADETLADIEDRAIDIFLDDVGDCDDDDDGDDDVDVDDDDDGQRGRGRHGRDR